MAIKSSYFSTLFHVELENSYQKIDNVRINNNNVSFDLHIYASKEARDANAQPITNAPFGLPLAQLDTYQGDNIIAKLYDFCKNAHPMYLTKETAIENV